MANIAPTPKAVALVLIPALVLTLAFAFSYVGAFHDPAPHHVSVAVVGPPAVAAELNHLPREPLDARQAASRPDALSQITIARSTAPSRRPRTACSWRRLPTEHGCSAPRLRDRRRPGALEREMFRGRVRDRRRTRVDSSLSSSDAALGVDSSAPGS